MPSNFSLGYLLSSQKFSNQFNFSFYGTLQEAVSVVHSSAPRSITPAGIHQRHAHGSIPCPVCGSTNLQPVLDLHKQPLANDFRTTSEDSMHCERHPLALMRCRLCNHVHLSQVVERRSLFSTYLYESGTSKTLGRHFDWLAGRFVCIVCTCIQTY